MGRSQGEHRGRGSIVVSGCSCIGAAFGWLSSARRVDLLGSGGYCVIADFPAVGGLRPGPVVEIAGVEVGRVDAHRTLADYQARVRPPI